LLSTEPLLLITSNAMPAKDLKELIAWLKANPGKALLGTTGAGTSDHVIGVSFQKETGTRFEFVPYRGASDALRDLLGGQIEMMLAVAAAVLPQVRDGAVKAYAVTSPNRAAAAPDIPTMEEAGLPGFHFTNWRALWAPKGTPKYVISTLNAAVVAALSDPAVGQRLGELGQEIPARNQLTPEALATFHAAEIEKWWPTIKAAGIKAE
jgi:tripartite-type tricarboxylate transporter receptor subunit TctC